MRHALSEDETMLHVCPEFGFSVVHHQANLVFRSLRSICAEVLSRRSPIHLRDGAAISASPLQQLNIFGKFVNSFGRKDLAAAGTVHLGVALEKLTAPDRHVPFAMTRYNKAAVDHRKNARVGELTAVLLGKTRQVCWALQQLFT
jgi:hypothetical protein